MPSLSEVLNQLRFISRELAVLGLFVTGGMIVLMRDWRASLLALLGQYLLAGLILAGLVLPEIALIKVLIGALVCPMLYLAARQAGWQAERNTLFASRKQAGNGRGNIFPAGGAFRLLAAALMTIIAIALSQTYPLPVIPSDVGLSSYWLILVGLLILMMTEEPLKAGQGLLTAITGFELLYTPLERSLTMVWLWAAVNLLLTLGIAYLAVVQGASSSEEDL